MNRILFSSLLCGLSISATATSPLVHTWDNHEDARWTGGDFWANRLQDWQVRNHRLECEADARLPVRTLHALTTNIASGSGFTLKVRTGPLADDAAANSASGFLIGAGAGEMDYRAAALIHHWHGPGAGMLAGVRADGSVFFHDFTQPYNPTSHAEPAGALPRDDWQVVRVDSAEQDQGGHRVIDGDPSTLWHTEWKTNRPKHPHEIVIDLGSRTTLGGIVALPRQQQESGRIKEVDIYLSTSASLPGQWGAPVATAVWDDADDAKRLLFAQPHEARYLRLVARSAHLDRPSTTLAELWALGPNPGPATPASGGGAGAAAYQLELTALPQQGILVLTARNAANQVVDQTSIAFDPNNIQGNVALFTDPGTGGGKRAGWWFDDWTLNPTPSSETGLSALRMYPGRQLGAILSSHYTVSRHVLKLTAQLFPVSTNTHNTVHLDIKRNGTWTPLAESPVIVPGYTATFRVPGWGAENDEQIRLRFGDDAWFALIRRDPAPNDRLILAGLSCGHQNSHAIGPGWGYARPTRPTPWLDGIWFPHNDLVPKIEAHDPDLLFFPGDQIYEGRSPTFPDTSTIMEDYLYKWYLWCWTWRDLTARIPSVIMPDDHDVYQGNLWGAGGRAAARDNEGGYVHPAEFVKMVERTQTAHLPDPVDPAPVDQGIGVYFTDLTWGRVSFALLEDRKFKSGCAGPAFPQSGTGRPDHFNNPDFDPTQLDLEGLKLLGDRQLTFLDAWARDWRGADQKVVLSQTIFANMATHHGPGLAQLRADLDSNGWPQSGRNRAVTAIRKAFALHIGGDQHLSTLIRHGVDAHDDAHWSYCLPATANFYPRKWAPSREGSHRPPDAPPWTGRHRDGFGNRVTVQAAANPGVSSGHDPADLYDKVPGYGIVRFTPSTGTTLIECWPRWVNPRQQNARQFEGWPHAIRMEENYARTPVAWLPTLQIAGCKRPVVEVTRDDNSLVYARRYPTFRIDLPVFAEGSYTVRVSDPDRGRSTTARLEAARSKGATAIQITVP